MRCVVGTSGPASRGWGGQIGLGYPATKGINVCHKLSTNFGADPRGDFAPRDEIEGCSRVWSLGGSIQHSTFQLEENCWVMLSYFAVFNPVCLTKDLRQYCEKYLNWYNLIDGLIVASKNCIEKSWATVRWTTKTRKRAAVGDPPHVEPKGRALRQKRAKQDLEIATRGKTNTCIFKHFLVMGCRRWVANAQLAHQKRLL